MYVQLHSDSQPGTVTIWTVAIELGISTMSLVNIDRLGMNRWIGGYGESVVPIYGIQYGGDGAVDDPVNPGWGCWWEHQDVPAFLETMKSWHWNTLRVALPIGLFMADRTTPNVARFQRLAALLDECERHDTRVILTGQLWNPNIRDPDGWGLESLNEAARWAWRQRFWFNVAKYCGSSPTVLLYDLASECGFTHTKRYRPSWYTATLSGYDFGEFLARTNANHSPPTVNQAAVDFIAMMTDPTHGTTACDVTPRTSVGRLFTDGGWSEVDRKGLTAAFMPHIYPSMGQAGSALAEWLTANGSHGDLPVVLEESGNLLGAFDEELIEMWGGVSERPDPRLAGSLSFAPSYVTPAQAVERPVSDRRAYLTLTNALTYLRAVPLALHQHGRQPLPRVAQRIFGRRQLYPRCCQRL